VTPALRVALSVLGVATVYIVAARFGEAFATLPGNISPVWPPSGVAVAAMLIFRTPAAFGVYIGAVLNSMLSNGAVWYDGLFGDVISALGDTLEAYAAWRLLGLFGATPDPFGRMRHVLAFVGLAAVAACTINPTIGLVSLSLSGVTPFDFATWATWWLGDAVGVIVFTPLIIAWRRWPSTGRGWLWTLELVGVLSCVVAVALIIVFVGASFEYVLLPPMIWAALRLGLHGVSLAMVGVSLTCVSLAANGAGSFTGEDLNRSLFLIQAFVGVASITPLVLVAVLAERRRAADRAQAERDRRSRLENDLAVANEVQSALLPIGRPRVAGFDIAGWNEPADETGGDYFDWQPLPHGRWAISIADVTGHGIGPALVTAFTRAYARSNLPTSEHLDSAMRRINELVEADISGGRFVTFAAVVLDPASNRAEMLSAGHGPSYVRRADGTVEQFQGNGLPLGIVDTWESSEPNVIDLAPGDAVILLTDGIFERADASKDQFGLQRLERVIAETRAEAAEDLIAAIRDAWSRHADAHPAVDDATIVVVLRNPGGG
jgi:serine phosphatase RsbU (regulator of sigma subunit)/integral membrane sensor domain MASE1